MFTARDLDHILQLNPPEKQLEHSRSLPPLILAVQNQCLLSRDELIEDFKALLASRDDRITIVRASSEFGVDTPIMRQMVDTHSHWAWFSQDETSIILPTERKAILERLQNQLDDHPLLESDACNKCDIASSSIDSLIQENSASIHREDGWLCSARYEVKVVEYLYGHLQTSLIDNQPFQLAPELVPGRPPSRLLHKLLQRCMVDHSLDASFAVEIHMDSIRCLPKRMLEKRHQTLLNGLASGQIAFVKLRTYLSEYKDFTPETGGSEPLFNDPQWTLTIKDVVVSRAWLANVAEEGRRKLADVGYVDCKTLFPEDSPLHMVQELIDHVVDDIDTSTSSQQSDYERFEDTLLTTHYATSQRTQLAEQVRDQAREVWTSFQRSADQEIVWRYANIESAIQAPMLRRLAREKTSETAMTGCFWAEIARLEKQSDDGLEAFWNERLLSRCHNYRQGVTAIEDEKLQASLSELVVVHMQRELLPEVIAKARTQNLICSRNARKNTKRLESSIRGELVSLGTIFSALAKFNRKQDIAEPTDAALIGSKADLVNDMTRRMQKPKTDGALLFLNLIVVLLAKHQPGIIYATGKYAPKLLRQLKMHVATEEYNQLEKWKEQAKLGTSSSEDKDAICRMASQS